MSAGQTLVLDLSELTDIDLAGLAALHECISHALELGADVTINPEEEVPSWPLALCNAVVQRARAEGE